MNVLLVEDDQSAQRLVEVVLCRAGYDVDIVSNGDDAIEHVNYKTYAAIVLDLMMPVLSGYEVLDWLREHEAEMLRHVVVTTAASSRDLQHLRSSEVFAILRKPFDIGELLTAVNACLDRQS